MALAISEKAKRHIGEPVHRITPEQLSTNPLLGAIFAQSQPYSRDGDLILTRDNKTISAAVHLGTDCVRIMVYENQFADRHQVITYFSNGTTAITYPKCNIQDFSQVGKILHQKNGFRSRKGHRQNRREREIAHSLINASNAWLQENSSSHDSKQGIDLHSLLNILDQNQRMTKADINSAPAFKIARLETDHINTDTITLVSLSSSERRSNITEVMAMRFMDNLTQEPGFLIVNIHGSEYHLYPNGKLLIYADSIPLSIEELYDYLSSVSNALMQHSIRYFSTHSDERYIAGRMLYSLQSFLTHSDYPYLQEGMIWEPLDAKVTNAGQKQGILPLGRQILTFPQLKQTSQSNTSSGEGWTLGHKIPYIQPVIPGIVETNDTTEDSFLL